MTTADREDLGGSVHGVCAPGFERVRTALGEILVAGAEVGAALAVYIGGEAVVDLWAGHADAARTRAWDRDTIVNLYSIGKAVTAICALRLVEAGSVEIDAPVARYWPEFAQAGKGRIPVRYLLTHQAGLPAIARLLPSGAWSDWRVMSEALAAQAPWWEPGAGHGYHVNTQGFLIGEVVRRVTGRTLGAYLRESFAGPASIDFFIGFGPELDERCAELVPRPATAEDAELQRQLSVDPRTLSGLPLMRLNAYRNPPALSGTGVVKHPRVARGGGAVDQRPRPCARGGAPVLGAGGGWHARRRSRALTGNGRARDRVRGGWGRPRAAAPHPLRSGVPAPDARAPARPQPARVRALRSRRVAGVCRPRYARCVRVRHESGPQWLAAQARPPPHRSGLRRAAVSGMASNAINPTTRSAAWIVCTGAFQARKRAATSGVTGVALRRATASTAPNPEA